MNFNDLNNLAWIEYEQRMQEIDRFSKYENVIIVYEPGWALRLAQGIVALISKAFAPSTKRAPELPVCTRECVTE